ncbi:hypothetical protein PG1C_12245 [Rugosibacter aromaticivorans]|uniref:DNA-3-methyladenine glycosylase II n=1 Tax=Rugosibacter aromaticivorans TaxID=1565605 RepID=A0A0C5JAR3_9PROT|nr:AlkA N-terminal domain-containing protein [Rugosibacter aromaticivorans]AJP48985.1 hypothetical protein PG1C_12245 [Rugosibacter aromaticivorans]TBR12919.1 MAG: DNA-3-methyladenine glycosylase 2 family protein [Rugosibacter sp.]
MKTTNLSCTVKLPDNFRRDDVLDFHRRDIQMIAERVAEDLLLKGLMWQGHPACLNIQFHDRHATIGLAIDGLIKNETDALIRMASMVRRMLGLTQAIEDFEQHYRHHRQLGSLIAGHPGLRVPLTATPFEALTWAITGQQISVNAAVSVRRKLIQTVGVQHTGGLWCYPDAHQMAGIDEAALRRAGFSQAKARTLIVLSQAIEQNRLPLDAWVNAPIVDTPLADEMSRQLLEVHGIGPWTVSYALLRGFGFLDGSLHGDAAVRRKMQRLLRSDEKISEQWAQYWLADFSPWRALVAAHLWAMPLEG